MTLQNPTSGPGNLKSFKVSSNKDGKDLDLSAGVVDYRYYENIMSNYITASATVIETGNTTNNVANAINGLPLRGGEKVDVVIEDVQGNQIVVPEGLYISRVRNADPSTLQELYQIDLSSKEYFLNENSRVIKRYEGNISSNVEEILNDILKSTGKIEIDPTGNSYNFLGNTRKPFYICTWLASRSIPPSTGKNSGPGGFLFFQTRDGLFFKSIDNLFSKKPIKRFIMNGTGLPVAGYDGNIRSYSIQSDIDMNLNQTIGAYNNRTVYFDYFNMCYKEIEFSIENASDSITSAGRNYINVNDEFINKPSRNLYYIKDIGTNPQGTGNQQLDNWKSDPTRQNFDSEQVLVQTIMRYNQLFTVQTNVIIDGDFSIRAGDIIECDFPELEANVNKGKNPQSGGIYMVGSVCHKVTPRETFTSLGLIRDSFGKKTRFAN